MIDDTISRAAALDALGERPVVWSDNDDYTLGERNQYDMDRLAIETVPSAQPDVPDTNVGDMISRQAAINAPVKMVSDGLDWVPVGHIKELPSAQPGWIPCSERLPKPNEYENDVRVYYLVQNEHGDMMVCSWHGSFWMQMYRNTYVEDQVVAWMPLPKPWGGEKP